MINLPEDRRPPLTPQLALRVTIIGGVALTLFAVIFFRLWFLQVLTGQQYLAQASVNVARTIDVPAERGEILDRSGHLLVDSRQALDVEVSPTELPVPIQSGNFLTVPRKDNVVYRRLARVLGISTKPTRCPIGGHKRHGRFHPHYYRLASIPCQVGSSVYQQPFSNVTVKTDVAADVQFYLAERANAFPGVLVQKVYLRSYPDKELAAQLFGTIGPISSAELKERQYRRTSEQAIIGQSGLEAEYDKYLRGTDGSQRIQINSTGQFQKYLRGTAPTAGHYLKLSLDTSLQQVGQSALQESISSNPPSNGGAFVAMSPTDGEIYAMGSLPSFNPNIFTKPVPKAEYDQLNNAASNYPLLNRAIMSAGPTGSTFKPLTATAALESGDWNVASNFDDTGKFCESGLCRQNAGHAAYGVLNLVQALKVSDDVFFYNLGALTNVDIPNGGPLQKWARGFGIGQPTGVDLPGEASGTLPTPAWRTNRNKLEAECDHLTHPTALFPTHPDHTLPPGGCGLADGTNRSWSIGDNVNLAVGQGDVQVTPLQLAVAYSALANGGTIVRPHLGLDVQSPSGTVLQRIDPPPTRHIDINPFYRTTILQGLREAASQPGGTSADVFGNFPEQVYGKTGTAQYTGQQDYSWYACFVPASATSKPIVVIVTVEQGGFGAVAAAPVAREILSQWFFNKRGAYTAGNSPDL